jgi:hypothetical protein
MSSIRTGQDFPTLNSLISELSNGLGVNNGNGTPGLSTPAQPQATTEIANPFQLPSLNSLNGLDNSQENQRNNNNNPQNMQAAPFLMVMMTLLALMMQMMAQTARNTGGFFIMIIGFFGGPGGANSPGNAGNAGNSLAPADPLALDLDGNGGVDMTSQEDGVQFDLNGDGNKQQVAWTQPKGDDTDGWLAWDRNGNGQVDNGKELFGDQHGMPNGFEELKKHDSNGDGIIDEKDPIYHELRIWQDKNHDGVSQPDELKNLKDAGIESINLNYQESDEKDVHGNELRQQSFFTRTQDRAQQIAQQQGVSVEEAQRGRAINVWV